MTQTRLDRSRTVSSGFTLVELLVVLAILALVTTSVAVAVRSPGSTELRATMRDMVANLRLTRDAAVRRHEEMTVWFDHVSGELIFGLIKRNQRLPHGTVVQFHPGLSPIVGSMPENLVFYADGSSTGGTMILHRGETTLVVNISWIDGSVSIDG